MKNCIGLDIGTSSVKGVLMREDGQVLQTIRAEIHYVRTKNGGREIEAEQFVTVCRNAVKRLAEASELPIAGVCASAASGNLLVLDKDYKPATPIFNWQDQRVTTEAEEIVGTMNADELYRQTGWPFDFKTFPLAHACYIKKHYPHMLESCGMVCMSTEYFYYTLTGKWGISTSAGTPFYCIDQQKERYIPEVLQVLGITEDKLPPILPCGTALGGVTEEAASLCGLAAGTPIVLGSFDHPSAARGTGVLHEGEVLLSCGTSWVVFSPIADRDKALESKMLIDPFLSPKGGCWAAMLSVPSVAERLWLYVSRFIDNSGHAYQTLSQLARKSTAGSNGLRIVLTEEPDERQIKKYAKEDVARAIMESMVRLLHEQLARIEALGISLASAVMVGGPSEDIMWHELIGEMCGVSVRVQHGAYAGAVGAAMLAGMGVGMYRDEADAYRICNREASRIYV